jgi:2-phosphosulfolactate phosphatase
MSKVVCEWGLAGIAAWRSRASVFVILDVLSFSTAVSVAVERGALIIPFPYSDPGAAAAEAARRGAVAAAPKRALGGQLSLSPSSLRQLDPGSRVLLPSPNGSQLSLETGETPTICGSLRNVSAVADAARDLAKDGVIAVIAAGERWPDQSLRPAIEDWLGAGAIIEALAGVEAPEATLARLAFSAVGHDLGDLIKGSISGRELIERGFEADVDIALEVNSSAAVPILVDGGYRSL